MHMSHIVNKRNVILRETLFLYYLINLVLSEQIKVSVIYTALNKMEKYRMHDPSPAYTKLPLEDDDDDLLDITPKESSKNQNAPAYCCRGFMKVLLILIALCLVAGITLLSVNYLRDVRKYDVINKVKRPSQDSNQVSYSYWYELILRFSDRKFGVQDDKCTIPSSQKIDCYPGGKASQGACVKKGCCWVPALSYDVRVQDTPWCFYPEDPSAGYKFDNIKNTETGVSAQYSRSDKSHWPDDVMKIQLDTYEETGSRFHFKVIDSSKSRYEVPITTPKVSTKASSSQYKAVVSRDKFGITVTRADNSGPVTLFDSSSFRLTYSNQFIEITTTVASRYLYGLGEHRDRFYHDTSKGFSMSTWARDQPPAGCVNCNLYGQHPFFVALDSTNQAYGVFLLNSNAMQISSSKDSSGNPSITYRTVGGILDFYIFTGPTPQLVVQQYIEVIGRPYMPPYWGLGYHLCRWGYKSADNMKKVIKRMRDGQFPYDTQWNDIDYMDNHFDWTYDKKKFSELPAIVDDLHQHGQHYIMIVDPGIRNQTGYPVYDEGVKNSVFVMKEKSDEPIIGVVWPGQTAFPDFFANQTIKWWTKQAQEYYQNVKFDGLWTDMNEPSNFGTGSVEGCGSGPLDNPPFTPSILGGDLKQKTICPSARHHSGTHYDLHSLYGHSEVIASHDALMEIRPGKRTVIISRSTFPSTGKYGGHWTGDNDSSWDDLKYSIPGILNFQLFGIPFVGADICGFMGTSNAELCVRWTQLGAFYPFMRNHNVLGSPDQDPGADMFDDIQKAAIMDALHLRYTVLPYLYTLLYRAHLNGSTVARPLWFEYPHDMKTYENDQQLMWGESLMVVPVLDQGKTSVNGYFPDDIWYEMMSGSLINKAGSVNIVAPLGKIPVYLRAGGIIPIGQPDVTTTKSRKLPFGLMVALDNESKACGTLFWDDGDTLETIENGKFNHLSFSVTEKGKLVSIVDHLGYTAESMTLARIQIYGAPNDLKTATVNGQTASLTKVEQMYVIADFKADLQKTVTVQWS